jgi:hypothetical protein
MEHTITLRDWIFTNWHERPDREMLNALDEEVAEALRARLGRKPHQRPKGRETEM